MPFQGKHLIDGTWRESVPVFASDPVSGASLTVCEAGSAEIDAAAQAAARAFRNFGRTSGDERAMLLDAIAAALEADAAQILAAAARETGLTDSRLSGEMARTTGQLRLFADHVRKGAHVERRHDPALPDRLPVPRPEIEMVQRPLGPVAVFGASNFPLAFSVAGGDTASALAAGCPVVFKGHPGHPETSELVARALASTVAKSGTDPGVFALIQGRGHAVGQALVDHPAIRAVGFTGSLAAGRALFDRCASRAVPIPFFGELGSLNPVFVLPEAATHRLPEIALGWAASITMGVGQFCTKPGVIFVPGSDHAARFSILVREALSQAHPLPMLTSAMATAFAAATDAVRQIEGVTTLLAGAAAQRAALPHVFATSARIWALEPMLHREVFGPAGFIVSCAPDEFEGIADALEGQLTATLQGDPGDEAVAAVLLPVLEGKAGRIIWNGFPTGVEVGQAMVHGGPYPASTNFGATSVGTLAIRRWLRLVAYQGFPLAIRRL